MKDMKAANALETAKAMQAAKATAPAKAMRGMQAAGVGARDWHTGSWSYARTGTAHGNGICRDQPQLVATKSEPIATETANSN